MGVYIPNMGKPKDCSYCILANKHINGLCEAKYYCRLEADFEHCPLIEIATCGECEYADEYNHCKYSAWWNGNADFCSHGIRRKESR